LWLGLSARPAVDHADLDEVTHLLELPEQRRGNRLLDDILVVLEPDRFERRAHARRVPDAAADLLDTNVTRFRKILLFRLCRPASRVPHECPRHQAVAPAGA